MTSSTMLPSGHMTSIVSVALLFIPEKVFSSFFYFLGVFPDVKGQRSGMSYVYRL